MDIYILKAEVPSRVFEIIDSNTGKERNALCHGQVPRIGMKLVAALIVSSMSHSKHLHLVKRGAQTRLVPHSHQVSAWSGPGLTPGRLKWLTEPTRSAHQKTLEAHLGDPPQRGAWSLWQTLSSHCTPSRAAARQSNAELHSLFDSQTLQKPRQSWAEMPQCCLNDPDNLAHMNERADAADYHSKRGNEKSFADGLAFLFCIVQYVIYQ